MSVNILARRSSHRGSVLFVRLLRVGLTFLLFFMLAVAANAYTLVLRNGRRVTVSDKFKMTPTALSYEASQGYWVTVWLSSVDIAATEKINGEPAGSFNGRIKRARDGAHAAPVRATQAVQTNRGVGRRAVTNRELEPARLAREAQEKEYERTRLERGMPSRQELQQRIEEQDRWLSDWAQRMREERREAELESLRSELVDARLQLNELSLHLLSQQGETFAPAHTSPNYSPYFYAPSAHLITVFPFGHRGAGWRARFGRHTHGRPWAYRSRPSHPFPRISRPFRKTGAPPRALPSRPNAPRRLR